LRLIEIFSTTFCVAVVVSLPPVVVGQHVESAAALLREYASNP